MATQPVIDGIRRRGLQFALLLTLTVLPVQAQALVGIGVTGKAGTTGLGADVTVPLISNWVNLRAGYNGFSFRPSTTQGDISYKADVQLQTVPLLIDVHPFNGSFRITGGVYYNKNELDLSALVDASTVGSAGSGIGTTNLNANITWADEFAPYFGIGFGNAADDSSGTVGFSLDIGAFYQGSSDVILTESSGTVSAADLAVEAQQIEEDLDSLKFYPVVTVGVHIRF